MTQQARVAEGERAYDYLRRAHDIEDFRRHYRGLLTAALAMDCIRDD